ncbi:LicD family protein [Chloroflexota bacterium]
MRRLDSFLEWLIGWAGRNKLLNKIIKSILLSYYVRKGFERIYRFYAVARFEKGIDPFIGGYYTRPWIPTPPGHTIDIKISADNLTDIKKILDENGIRFWLMFGTFLGAYRDGAIIPYDEDTDLAICSEDLPLLVQCEEELNKKGFTLAVLPLSATLYRDNEHTDIYCFSLEEGKRVWNEIKCDANAFDIYCDVQFLDQKWRILNDPERWLKYTYGDDWETPIKGKGILGYAYGERFESS